MNIVETKICKQTGKEFHVTQHEVDLLEQISPVLGGKKYHIPVSDYHPDVSHQWHLAWRNERNLYKTTCDLTGKIIISGVNPAQGYTIYNFHARWSDAVDPFAYGKPIDLTKTFTEQFGEIFRAMPVMSLNLSTHMDNCDYCNYGYHAKDCYMCTTAALSEQCYYSHLPYKCKYDVDGYGNTGCEYTYGCIYSMQCYESQHAYYSNDCTYSSYLLDCRNCEYCFGCVNLSHKKYCFFNEQLDEQTYEKRLINYKLGHTEKEMADLFFAFSLTLPRRATRGANNEGTIGDQNYNTKNCYHCFDLQESKDMTYCWICALHATDFVRSTLCGANASRYYDCAGQGESDSCAWCIGSNSCYQLFYSYYCRDCEHCFGCIRLEHKKYCIFNVQYTQEEYEKLLPQLIMRMQETGERGEFLNPSIAPFPYNDTCAHESFPETKDVLLKRGRGWIDHEFNVLSTDGYTLKDIGFYTSSEGEEELLGATLKCDVSGRPYRIIQQELDFYTKFSISIPTKHYESRYQERYNKRILPRTLYERTCAKTGNKIMTPYAPERPEIVWSEEAWDQEFLG